MHYYYREAKMLEPQLELAKACTEQFPDTTGTYVLLRDAAVASKRLDSISRLLERRLIERPGSTGLLFGLGAVAHYSNRLDEARTHVERAWRAAPDNTEVGAVLNEIYSEMRRYQEAAHVAEKLFSTATAIGDTDLASRAAIRQASAMIVLGDIRKGGELLRSGLAMGEGLQRGAGLRHNHEILGDLYYQLDQFPEALREFQTALRISLELREPDCSRIQNYIGVVYRAMGKHAQGVEAYQQALKLAADRNDNSSRSWALSNLASTYLDLGNDEAAIHHARQALETSRSLAPWTAARITMDLAFVTEQVGRTTDAATLYAESIRVADGLDDFHTALRARVSRAALLTRLGRLAEAESDLRSATALLPNVEVRNAETALWIAWGRHSIRRGNAADAIQHFSKGLQGIGSLQLPALIAQCQTGLADAYAMKGDLESAVAHRRKAIDMTEQIRASLVTPDQRAGFLSSRVHLYKDAARDLARLGRTEEAFHTAEAGRARAMLDFVTDGNPSLEAVSDEERIIRKRLRVAQDDVRKLSMNKADLSKLKTARLQLETAESELATLWISKAAPTASPSARTATLQAIQAAITPGSVLLHYTLRREAGLLFAVTSDKIVRYTLPSAAAVEQPVRRLRGLLSQPPDRLTQRQWMADAHRLYQLLLAPAARTIGNAKEWIIVPDGVLHMLPFEVLLATLPETAEPANLPYAGKTRFIRYVPSASVMLALNQSRRTSNEKVLAIGGALYGSTPGAEMSTAPLARGITALRPLPHSKTEVQRFAQIYRDPPAHILIAEQATESILKSSPEFRNAGILHFAVHGLLNERRPQFSGLVLSQPRQGEPDDGFLQAFEIAALKLNAEVAVLSACETALGKEVTGEGIAGLARSFFYAGARRLVASLWRVDDQSTAAYMLSFHRALQSGRSASEAMRHAKQELIRRTEYAHPYYWAPFVLMGAQ